MNTSQPERRRSPRVEADFPIEIMARDSRPAKLMNISTSGLCCLTRRPLAEFTQTRTAIKLPSPGGETREFELEGAVVRCEPRGEGEYELAIFFQFPPAEAQELISTYVQQRALTRN